MNVGDRAGHKGTKRSLFAAFWSRPTKKRGHSRFARESKRGPSLSRYCRELSRQERRRCRRGLPRSAGKAGAWRASISRAATAQRPRTASAHRSTAHRRSVISPHGNRRRDSCRDQAGMAPVGGPSVVRSGPAPASSGAGAAELTSWPLSACIRGPIRSIGSGKTIVEFCSLPISSSVCR